VATELRVLAVAGMPEVSRGDDLAALLADALARAVMPLEDGDVIVVAQKIVSKAEGAVVDLRAVEPSPFAAAWAAAHGKDAAMVEVVLREARRVVRMDRGVIIAETHHGLVCANAGVDASNVLDGFATTLPRDPDASAARLCAALSAGTGRRIAVVIADTFGRPWREGVVNVAIGVAGLQPLDDWRGRADRFGRLLSSTVIAVADEIASAAALVMAKDGGVPAAIVRGAGEWGGDGCAAGLIRRAAEDMFR
jgi:coenzyme F420-0:L-glutamate ligase/coenzyme F420-1:gamma-L-glutamate ligase